VAKHFFKSKAPIESPCRVDKKYVVFKNVFLDIWPKEAKK
jgi:hypothetical protein